MALITPRRRFLITAPLALLLPAGLLTYLGLQTVGLVENRHIETIQNEVNKIVQGVRNRTRDQLQHQILTPFRTAFVNHLDELLPTPPEEAYTFTVRDAMPYAKLVFVYGKSGRIYFFEKEQNPDAVSSVWRLSGLPRESLGSRLISAFEAENDTFSIYENPQRIKDFSPVIYPDNLMVQEPQRELAFYMMSGKETLEEPTRQPDWIKAAGFTIDFNYLNTVFFDRIIQQMWQIEGDLRYPILIEDRVTGKSVADVNLMGEPNFKPSSKYTPRPFSDVYFPWYYVNFSAGTGEDIMKVAENEKMVYYCLIAAANVCLVAAVFGALRNIAKELALSDMRSNFVARVSHELRTPLGLIRLFAETMEMDRILDEAKKKEYLHAITKESERLSHLINNILNFSQMESHKKQYNFRWTPIEDVIYDTVDAMHYHFQRHDMNVDLDLSTDLPKIHCDREAIEQALYNILSNAVKYSGDGMSIDVRAYTVNRSVVIEVADQGIGISPEFQKKIFQEFFRVNDPRVQETGGSGLGLAVVKHIVEGHGGKISVKSNPDEGSTFMIQIPIDPQHLDS
ncbi:MAG: hypothetical protein GC154_16825 [bacterium]|nr:hypothetical protein [bacterium]